MNNPALKEGDKARFLHPEKLTIKSIINYIAICTWKGKNGELKEISIPYEYLSPLKNWDGIDTVVDAFI